MHDVTTARPRTAFVPWAQIIFVALWTWAIWSCAEHWRGNPNYSYGWSVPLLGLGFGLRRFWQSAGEFNEGKSVGFVRQDLIFGLAIASAGLVFGLEFGRQQMWHPQLVLYAICFLAIGFSLGTFFLRGGKRLARAELFPVLFFLTAVPWPPRLEQPITSALMRWVASATAELLNWLGVEAQTSGGAIALRAGLVGITEACSGIRSLQAGIMFGLAMGEWFLLRPARRVLLLAIAVTLALLTNLARTLALALQAEWHGVPSVESVHDLIGNIIITALVVGIWLSGRLLAPRRPPVVLPAFAAVWGDLRDFTRRLFAPRGHGYAVVAIAAFAGFVAARGAYAVMEAKDHPQTVAFFVAQPQAAEGDRTVPVPQEIWNELRPTSGEYVRREANELPRGVADLYHFFWKPSPWNRFALVHRPDICMPGVGWKSTGAPDVVEVNFDGRLVRCYAFRFERDQYRALQLWGVWRNGEPVSLDYQPGQVLGAAEPPPQLHLEGKRRSATEIVACSLIAEHFAPSTEMAVALLRSVFVYRPQ